MSYLSTTIYSNKTFKYQTTILKYQTMSGNLLKAVLLCDSDSEEEAYALAHQQEEEELMEIYREA